MSSTSERAYALVEYALFRNAPKSYRRLYTLYKRWTDRGEWRWFQSILRPGMIVADVGSNIGVCTELFARLVGPAGIVHSFEPALGIACYTNVVVCRRLHDGPHP